MKVSKFYVQAQDCECHFALLSLHQSGKPAYDGSFGYGSSRGRRRSRWSYDDNDEESESGSPDTEFEEISGANAPTAAGRLAAKVVERWDKVPPNHEFCVLVQTSVCERLRCDPRAMSKERRAACGSWAASSPALSADLLADVS
ncbi:MAG TPA: hypothetical protein VFE62_25585 [Gemmataceae bacterium]|nr:hypothetical protein [Gemmataceae bacterium]